MKTLKAFIVFASLLFAAQTFGQVSTLSVFTARTFAKATTSEDTSSSLSVGAYPYVTVHCTTTGSDSSVIYQNIDAYINGVWVNNILRDTVTLGRPAGYTLASSKGQVKYRMIRMPSSDLIGSAATIRIRNKHAAGAGDSTSALTYTQKILLRKP